jgi:hypothetical protein
MTAAQQLHSIRDQLAAVSTGDARADALVRVARESSTLLAALPQKYSLVLHDILDRLESGALFTEESCSFSQRDLLDSLQLWIDKAQSQLKP